MFSKFFVHRPVFAGVLSLVIMLAGYLAIQGLPVAQYPEIVPPQVTVSTTYPGASAETLSESVASPLEQAINGVDNMLYISSSASSSGALSITATFDIGTDVDKAATDVNNRVQSALSRLPAAVQAQGVNVAKQSASILQVVSLYSENNQQDTLFIANYSLLNIVDDLNRIPGVGQVVQFGAKDYAMRIWFDPEKLVQYDLSANEVAAAIRAQNSQYASGRLAQEPMTNPQAYTYSLIGQGRLADVESFENIVLRTDSNGSSLHLKDVARVELGSQAYNFDATYDGLATVPIGIFLQPGANALETAEKIKVLLDEKAERFPEGLKYSIPFDTTQFVRISIQEVMKTFAEAMLLVVVVVLLFLQNWRATLIPLLAVPVSIIGTFAGMYALGFSINLLTLFGLILAIGIVVDDAIIVVENVERLMTEKALSAKEATVEAMREITGPVIAIVLVLGAVFIPVAFLGGLSGQMYKQFAITIVISVTISGIVALTLTPALCATLLKPHTHAKSGPFAWFNKGFDALTNGFSRGVQLVIRFSLIAVILFAGMIGITWKMYQTIPSSLVPPEDQGYLFVLNYLPPASSLSRSIEERDKITEAVLANPNVDHITAFAGFDFQTFTNKTDSGAAFVTLKPWSERPLPNQSAEAVAGQIFGATAGFGESFVIPITPPPISGMSNTGGFEVFVQNRVGDKLSVMSGHIDKLVAAAAQEPALTQVRTTLQTYVPQYEMEVNFDKAYAMGVTLDALYSAIQASFGGMYINDFNLQGRTFQVTLQADADFRERPADLQRSFVRSSTGEQVPLSTLIELKRITGSDVADRFNLFSAAKMFGEPAPGYSSGQALEAFERLAAETLPEGYTLGWIGSAYQEKAAAQSGNLAFVYGIILVFLILAAQYERWLVPVAVLTAVPFAVFGALIAIHLRGLSNDIYFQVGILTLIGLSAKNAILIVEFALQKIREGEAIVEATVHAARQRLRPIIMTSLAFTLGVIPLALSSGAGASSRIAIGTGVIGGMIAATFLAIFFIPLFFTWVARLTIKAPTTAEQATLQESKHD